MDGHTTMNKMLFLLSILFILSCNSSKPAKNNSIKKTDSLPETTESDSTKKVDIGYAERYEKLPALTFETITEKEFLSLEQKEYIQILKPEQRGNFFYLQTVLRKHKFKKYKEYGGEESWSGFEYSGYYPTSKLFALTENSTAEGLGFGQLFLLDSLTDYEYTIISFGDGSVELPIPSINNKYFVYFYNSVYEHKNCDIGILKINSKSDPATYLSEHASYHSDDFAIEKIVWKTDNCFYVKGYEEVYKNNQWVKKYTYYKTEFE